ncbi:hypothetical protein [Bifidobacterium gallicum]|uniref:Riboflavin deaminase n=1 Tax=Bifidobacterium gallicum DSM 20093 = LMG 11596 TaxID=561180 RepID=D1NVR7_9BIFI|nr:hypothetical protein [Bifidobacterium gallicum]EFA22918.1 hypothetical protein BIFGAL_03959 [Bifidobacterium gallicum DSM 20093 = LMG 11596]KFI59384.1 riboflavin deaminase [Bifidobacterium gallicum DSM 20093 = LMG 11596]
MSASMNMNMDATNNGASHDDTIVRPKALRYAMRDDDFVQALIDFSDQFEEAVERRLDGHSTLKLTGKAFDRMLEDDSCIDADLHRTSLQLFGSPHWTRMFDWAAACADTALVEWCHALLQHVMTWTEQYDICTWLYVLINDAKVAQVMQQPAPTMPILGPVTGRRMARWLHGSGIERYGTANAIESMMRDFADETYRVAAYCCLTWGVDDHPSVNMASMLLLQQDIGRPLLRDSADVNAFMGPAPVLHHREVMDYLLQLRAQADLEYARDLQRYHDLLESQSQESPEPQETQPAAKREWTRTMQLIDRRYLYDLERVIEAYQALWNTPTMKMDEIMQCVRDGAVLPNMKAWENPVLLNDVAGSLIGSFHAEMLRTAFERRDRVRFQNTVNWMTEHGRIVEQAGFQSLPLSMVVRCEMQDAQHRGEAPSKREIWDYWMLQMADNMAAVLLNRLPDPAQARKAARALMVHDLDGHLNALQAKIEGCDELHT